MTTRTLTFTLDGFHNRMRPDWARARRSIVGTPEGAAKFHARTHGAAGIWNADDSFILFYRDGDRVRRRKFRRAAPVN